MSNEMNNTRKTLRDRAKEFDVRLPFMEGRDKGDAKELLDTVNTITDFGFLPNEQGEHYAVFIIKERPSKFYFGGSVLTDRLIQLEADGYHAEIVAEGLPVLMVEKKSRNNRMFTNVIFYPED